MKLIFDTNFTINHDNFENLEKYVNKECKIGNEYNCFYDIYCDNTYISKINKNRLHSFIHYIENYNNENIYKYSLILHRKE